jgi:hypothetical protein
VQRANRMQIGTILAIVPDNHSEPTLRAAKESPIEGFAVEALIVLGASATGRQADSTSSPSRPHRRPSLEAWNSTDWHRRAACSSQYPGVREPELVGRFLDSDRHEEPEDGPISLRLDLEPPREWKLGCLAAQASQIQLFARRPSRVTTPRQWSALRRRHRRNPPEPVRSWGAAVCQPWQ